MTQVLKLYQRLHEFPLGKLAFSIAFALKAPYFRTICPRVQLLEPGKAVVRMAHWWGVNNHIGTVHAIACCNLVEMAMGACAEASIPKHLRWLPRGMDVKYVKKAVGCELKYTQQQAPQYISAFIQMNSIVVAGDVSMPVTVTDAAGDAVVTAHVHLYITEKPNASTKRS